VPAPAPAGPAAARARQPGARLLRWLAPAALLLLAAGLFVERGWRATQLREAYLPELEAQAQAHPGDGGLLAVLGLRLSEAGDYGAAAHALQQSVAAGGGDEAVWLTWAAAAAASGDAAQAGAVLRLGLHDRPDLAPALHAAIERCRPLGANPAPVRLAQAICPGGTRLLARRCAAGSILNRFGDWCPWHRPETSGFATRERWARERPRDARAQRLWGEALARNRRLPEAEAVLRHAVELAPGSPEAHLALGDVLAARGAPAKAGLEYVAALKRRPDWLPALLAFGRVALEKTLIPIAVDVFERATRAAPKSADAWIGLGRAYYTQRLNLTKALAAYETAARLAPDRTDYFADYFKTLLATYRYDEAEAVVRRRLAAAPDDSECHFLLALALLDHRPTPARQAEAEQELRASLRYQPHAPAVEARLAQLLLRRGNAPEAITHAEAALKDDPYSLMAVMTLARAYRQVGRAKEAAAAGERLAWLSQYTQRAAFLEDQIHRQPDNRKAHEELAQLFAAGGEMEKAEREAEMAYMLRTRTQEAAHNLAALRSAVTTVHPAPEKPRR
jgi:tetratricopeptide (TPR) repeat protein